ncbi:3-oxoacyl-ACP synthase (plasmid) [Lactiplantibacillus plantarum]|uniref:3-oxoacyl-ACP synthase n=3 Tax=Lactiplantibacillus TaxID=2767842 RepID=A0A4Q9XZ87_9LACO|nr:3-oxoacyl-ACP synthase [Lactiplantibacillus plantarum]TBX32860.1 3-oxoacyl-ACP synthase [Lactiplantibacillus paraplantarum]
MEAQMMINDVGIVSIGVSIPFLRLPVEQTISVWKNNSLEFIKNVINVSRRTVISSDEDVLTMSAESSKRALEKASVSSDNLDAILLGSCTVPDLFRSNANQVMTFLNGENKQYTGFDIKSAEDSGVAALLTGISFLKSDMYKEVLCIGSDTLNRHIFPSELREPYMGAGSAACVLGVGRNVIASVIGYGHSNDTFLEQARPEDERFIRITAPLNSDVINKGLVTRCKESISLALKEAKLNRSEIDYVALPHSGNPSLQHLVQISNITQGWDSKSVFTKDTGDIGSATPLVSLSLALDKAKVSDKILVCGYGHSSGSTSIIFKVTDAIKEYQRVSDTRRIIQHYKDINYDEAMKYEFKYVQPEIALGTFI